MGRVLGIDYGRKRVGAALSDPGRKIATPLEIYEQRDPVQNSRHYRELVAEHEVESLVVGLPVHTSGRPGELSASARSWGNWLAKAVGLPIAFFDERYTSVEADRVLRDAGFNGRKRQGFRDMLAAQMMLQAYLDAGCPTLEIDSLPLDDPTGVE